MAARGGADQDQPDANATQGSHEDPKHPSSTVVQAVSIKMPPFTERCPERWFLHIEAQFRLGNITASRTKFDYILASVPMDAFEMLALETIDLKKDPYAELKAAIFARYSEPPESQVASALALRGDDIKLVHQCLCSLLDPAYVPDLRETLIRELLLQQVSAKDRKCARPFMGQALDDFARVLDMFRAQTRGVAQVDEEVEGEDPVCAVTGKAAPVCRLHWQFGLKAYRWTRPKTCIFGPDRVTSKEQASAGKQRRRRRKNSEEPSN